MSEFKLIISDDIECSLSEFISANKELSKFEINAIIDLEIGESIHIDFTEVKRIK